MTLYAAFFRRSLISALCAILGVCLGASFARGAPPDVGKASPTSEVDQIVHELCGKSVALLGESPLHGFGKTLAFKAALVPRLIDECHYSAFFIESGIYDFLNIQKKLKSGQEVTEPTIRSGDRRAMGDSRSATADSILLGKSEGWQRYPRGPR